MEVFQKELQSDLLLSLRHQLTKTALSNHKLKAKANRVPIYQPRKKINRNELRNLYRKMKNKASTDALEDDHKQALSSELQEALKLQLARLEADLAAKHLEEEQVKESLETELSQSLRVQFSSVLRGLTTTTIRPSDQLSPTLSDSQLKLALEEQLRQLFNQ